jgi:hypothetical protein
VTTWNKAIHVRNPIKKLYTFYKNNGVSELIAFHQNQLNKVVNGELTPITGTLTSDSFRFITYKNRSIQDVVLVADGGKLKAYDGVSVSEVTPHVPYDNPEGTPKESTDPGLNDMANLTNFRKFALKKDRLFVAAHPTIKNRVNFCYFDPYLGYAVYDYFPATYFVDVAVEDNDEIVELKTFRNVLVILCKRSIWVLKGDGSTIVDYELIKINVPKGCIAPDSVQEVGNNLFYLAENHVFSLYATEQEFISAQIVSDKVVSTLKSMGVSDKSKAVSVFHDSKYYLSFPNGTTLVYDVTLESWSKYTNIQANSFLVIDDVLYFSTDEGVIYQFDENTYSDDSDPISFLMKTKICDFDLPVHLKKFKKMWVIQKQWDNFNSTYGLKALIDQYTVLDINDLNGDYNTENAATWDESNWDEVVWDFAEVTQNPIKFREKGKSVQLIIDNDKANEPLTIYGIAFQYKPKKAK